MPALRAAATMPWQPAARRPRAIPEAAVLAAPQPQKMQAISAPLVQTDAARIATASGTAPALCPKAPPLAEFACKSPRAPRTARAKPTAAPWFADHHRPAVVRMVTGHAFPRA